MQKPLNNKGDFQKSWFFSRKMAEKGPNFCKVGIGFTSLRSEMGWTQFFLNVLKSFIC